MEEAALIGPLKEFSTLQILTIIVRTNHAMAESLHVMLVPLRRNLGEDYHADDDD